MNYFEENTNEDLKNVFLKCLHCRKELTHYVYPYESMEDGNPVDEHIIRCQNIFTEYLINIVAGSDSNLKTNEIDTIVKSKNKEIFKLVSDDIETYYESVTVKYVDL